MPLRSKIRVAIIAVLALTFAYFYTRYSRFDRETADITDTVRHRAAGEFIRLSDGLTHYELAGPDAGPVVVLIHGFSVPYFLWDHTFQPLADAGFRVIRYDFYGRGLSDRPDIRYDADLYDRQLSDLLNALHVAQPVDLVGASLGGQVAASFTVRHPDKVRSVSLFDPGYQDGSPLPWQIRAPILGEYIGCVEIAPTLTESQREDFLHPDRYPEYFIRYEQQMQYRGFRRSLLSTARYYLSRDMRPDYRSLGLSHKPVLLLWGKKDQDVPFAVSKDLLQNVPQAEFHAIDDAAHVGFYEHPEIVNPILIEFLRAH
jgi:pimeloyl-ACP methyl ester carboxylesterase